jgi:hypothetical protein
VYQSWRKQRKTVSKGNVSEEKYGNSYSCPFLTADFPTYVRPGLSISLDYRQNISLVTYKNFNHLNKFFNNKEFYDNHQKNYIFAQDFVPVLRMYKW